MTTSARLPGLEDPLLLQPRAFGDARGFFYEPYQEPRFLALGIRDRFVQDNHSRSCARTLRGLHFQSSPGQAKLITVIRGRIFDVVVDIRPGSATFGRWAGAYLDDVTHAQMYVPVGFAHGFCVVNELADVVYKVSSTYEPATECGFRWDDPAVGIEWPVEDPLLSERDQAAPLLADLPAALRR